MGDQPLLVLHIVQVENWYDFYGKEQDYTRKTGVEFTKIYHLKIQILSYSSAKHFGMKSKRLNVEKMHYLQESLRLHFPVS